MVLIFEIPLASLAITLCVISWKTMQKIKHLAVGRSFWLPILSSGILFFAASFVAILVDLGFSFTAYAVEIVSISRLLALCFLAGGVYAYSRTITKNLVQGINLAVKPVGKEVEENTESSTLIIERMNETAKKKEPDCKHEFGYLRTLKKQAEVPEECLSCHHVIECKFSQTKSECKSEMDLTSPDTMISGSILEKQDADRSS